MEIKQRHIIFLLFIIISANLSCIGLYSQNATQKPSRQAAMDAFTKADYETALREFSILLQNYSKDPIYKYYSGVCLVKMSRNPDDATGFLEDAINGSLDIKSIPDDAWFYLGRSQQMTGRFADAIESYNNFEKKAGRKVARSYGIDTYIQECNQGKGRLKESGPAKEPAATKAAVVVVPASQKITEPKPAAQPAAKAVPQKGDVPRDYDKVLSEAMKYQVKADSVNALVAAYKKEYDRLPPSQKDAAKLRISEMELLAAEYQKIADDKFGNTGTQPAAGKEVVIPAPVPPQPTPDKEIYSLFGVEKNPDLKGQNAISIDPELPAGLIYRIQMGVFSKPPDPSFFKGIYPVAGFRVSGTESTRYFVGMFRTMEDANRALLTVKQMGFKDSFITAVLDGKAVSIDRAALLETEWGKKPLIVIGLAPKTGEIAPLTLNFRVEISRSVKPVSDEVAASYKKLAGNRGFEILSTDGSFYVYLIGKFITFESASEYADLLKRNGYRESKVVAYLGSKEIPVETAMQLFEK